MIHIYIPHKPDSLIGEIPHNSKDQRKIDFNMKDNILEGVDMKNFCIV